jgi:putative membrane protein
MLKKILFNVIAGGLGLFLAVKLSQSREISFIQGIDYNGPIKTIFITGGFLGLVNFFVKPILKTISLPLRILTFNLFTLIINMFLVWVVVDVFSPIEIRGIISLFWTTTFVLLLNFGLGLISKSNY